MRPKNLKKTAVRARHINHNALNAISLAAYAATAKYGFIASRIQDWIREAIRRLQDQ